MAVTPALAAALSGASTSQLAYWRSARTAEPLLAPAHHQPGSRASYSFRDVVALRTFVYLRSRDVPLPHARQAVSILRTLGRATRLSEYSLVVVGQNVAWVPTAAVAPKPTGGPAWRVLARMADILAPFVNARNEHVPDLHRPIPGVCIDPEIRSGFPVVEGTRIPYDLVAGLFDDSSDSTAVTDIYPSVTADAARGAAEFARYVHTFDRRPAAA